MSASLPSSRRGWRRPASLVALLALFGQFPPHEAGAFEWLEETRLVDVSVGSLRSGAARDLGRGGYELAGGDYVDLGPWYTPDLREISFLFLNPLSENAGVLWGFSTGERGEKYRIYPAIRFGLTLRHPLGRNGALSFTVLAVAGGDLRESPCSADYGALGGVQLVNCRLAAGLLPPEQTLQYLARLDGSVETFATLRLEFKF